ncbi:MAG: hypothetical protein NUW23_02475 [Firmicutes bacterium]|nr:hypothetical protein [Bacillota bacterium]
MRILLESVQAAIDDGISPRAGFQTASRLGTTFKACETKWHKYKRKHHLKDLKQALLEKVEERTPLTIKEIESAAEESGVHYHTALSTLGALHRNGEVNGHKNLLDGIRQILEALLADAKQRIVALHCTITDLKTLLSAVPSKMCNETEPSI